MSLLRPSQYLSDLASVSRVSPVVGPPVAHRAWCEARDRAMAAVRAGGLVLVLGPPGTGKSLLLRELARASEASGYDVLLQTRGDAPAETVAAATVAAAPGESADRPDGAPARVVAERARPRVVLIDEAHRLDGAALDRLGRLGARRVVLAGLSGDGGGLDRLPVRAVVVHLAPLPPDEVGAFAAAWLARDGRRAAPPDEHAARRLVERSGGVPRALDALLGAAASLAAAEGASRIEASHVERAETASGDAAASPAPSPRADIRADTPPIARPDGDPAPAHGATVRVRPSAVWGASLCAAAGVAAVSGWLWWRSDERDRRERPASVAFAPTPGPDRIEAAPAPPVTDPAAPAAVARVGPSESDRPGPVHLDAPAPPEPNPAASESVAPASPDPAAAAESASAAATVAAVMAPEPAAPAVVRPDASTASVEPGAAAVPEPTTPAAAQTATGPDAVAPVRPGASAGPEPAASTASPAAVETVAPAAPEPAVGAVAPVRPGTPGGAGPEPGASATPERREPARDAPMPAPARSGPEIAAAARPPPVALPAGAPAHVVIYHPRDDAHAAARAAVLARALRADGMAVGEPVPVPQRGGRPGVRYFFAEDRDAAAAVLERAGLAGEDVLPGVARPGVLPRPGMIEVTLPPG